MNLQPKQSVIDEFMPKFTAPSEIWFSHLKTKVREDKLRYLKQANLIKNLILATGLK